MKFYPYHTFSIETSKSPQEVLGVFAKHTETKKRFNPYAVKDYKGIVGERSFEIRRILTDQKNAFSPVIEGRVDSSAAGSIIEIAMRLSTVAWGVVCFTLLIAIVLCIENVVNFETFSISTVFPFLMLLAAILLPSLFLWSETRKEQGELELLINRK